MASFPYTFQANFETADLSEFDSTTGTQVELRSYRDLARNRAWPMPYRGAYSLEAEYGVDTDSYVTSTTMVIGSGATRHYRFMLSLSKDMTSATGTVAEADILYLAPVVAAVGLRVDSEGEVKIGMRNSTDTLTTSDIVLPKGEWLTVEVEVNTTNASTSYLRVKELGIEIETTNALATGATTETRFGLIDTSVGALSDVQGRVFFDEIVFDAERIYGYQERFPQRVLINAAQQHVFLGPGRIEDIQLLAGAGTDCVLEIYDTDRAETSNSNLVARLTNEVSGETKDYGGRDDIQIHKGAYIKLTGTDPQAIVALGI